MKRFFPLILALAVLAAVIFLANRDPEDTGGKKRRKLVVASRLWAPPHEKEFVLTRVIRPFEEEHGCTVDFQTFDDDSLLKKAQVQKATGNVSTDVVIAYVSRMREWVENGYVADLTEAVSSWDDRSFGQGFAGMTAIEGRQYFAPIGGDVYLFCANRKALKYLPDTADPTNLTWNQLADWSLAVAEGEGQGKFAFSGVAQKMLIYQVSAPILSYGGGFPDLSSKGAHEAWRLLLRMRPGFAPTIQSYDSVVPPMKRRETWLTVAHCARVGEIYSSNPTEFIIAPAPHGPEGIGSVAGVSGFAVMEGTAEKELSLEFIEYMTSPAVQLQLAKGTGGFIPTVKETAALLGDTDRDEIIRNAINVLDNGSLAYIPACEEWASVKLVFDETFNTMIMDNGRIDPEYLDRMQNKINAVVDHVR
jgi:multiple sugar transport system substrate-binding protein